MTPPERAITIKQPWAGLVVSGVKRTENRRRHHPWSSAVGERLWIHAGLSVDRAAWQHDPVRTHAPGSLATIRGALIGSAVLLGVHPGRDLERSTVCRCDPDWRMDDHWHLVFGDARPLHRPVPARGSLGLWRPSGGER
ncbi:MAG: hypothetical protein ACXV2H_07140 [Actinomycetes bacterium]